MKKKKQEEKIVREIYSTIEPKSRAKRIRMLVKKNEATFKDKQALTDFKEPTLWLIRRSGAVEFFEDASKGTFVFKHSDGYNREIYLEPSSQLSFDYGKRKFKGYICQEDHPLPLPENPIVTSETVNSIVEKVGMDMKKLNTKAKEIQIKLIKTLGFVIGGLILVWMLYKAHAFDKIIGFLTGQPYVDPATIVNSIGQANKSITENIQDNSLNILSGITGN